MQQPEHDLRAFRSSPVSTNRFVALAAVIAIHVVVIWALATGLASQFIKKLPDEFKAEVVKEAPPPQEKAPPPPPPDLAKPPPPFVPPPDINISEPSSNSTAISEVQSRVATPPPPPKPVATIEPARGIESSHTTPEYPPISRRLGEQGTVTLKIVISTDGEVSEATVAQSSGYSRLDEAAVEWVKRHWRYHPATEGGKPIATSTLARVRFNLQG